jgi:hypothetical protein
MDFISKAIIMDKFIFDDSIYTYGSSSEEEEEQEEKQGTSHLLDYYTGVYHYYSFWIVPSLKKMKLAITKCRVPAKSKESKMVRARFQYNNVYIIYLSNIE